MDASLARGFARSYLDSLHSYRAMLGWAERSGPDKCIAIVGKFSCAKKPGRVAKRLTAPLRPLFSRPQIVEWTRHSKIVHAQCVCRCTETAVFDRAANQDDGHGAAFRESSAFLSDLYIESDDHANRLQICTAANISQHALKRLLQRRAAQGATIQRLARASLRRAALVAYGSVYARLDADTLHAFLIPFGDGALVGVRMPTADDMTHAQPPQQVISIRTYLGPEMIDAPKERRMQPLRQLLERDPEPGLSDYGEILRLNARPYRPDRAALPSPRRA